jgi:hypothetical protein
LVIQNVEGRIWYHISSVVQQQEVAYGAKNDEHEEQTDVDLFRIQGEEIGTPFAWITKERYSDSSKRGSKGQSRLLARKPETRT